MEARTTQKTVLDVRQARLPQLTARLAALRSGHGRRRWRTADAAARHHVRHHVHVRRSGRRHYCVRMNHGHGVECGRLLVVVEMVVELLVVVVMLCACCDCSGSGGCGQIGTR